MQSQPTTADVEWTVTTYGLVGNNMNTDAYDDDKLYKVLNGDDNCTPAEWAVHIEEHYPGCSMLSKDHWAGTREEFSDHLTKCDFDHSLSTVTSKYSADHGVSTHYYNIWTDCPDSNTTSGLPGSQGCTHNPTGLPAHS